MPTPRHSSYLHPPLQQGGRAASEDWLSAGVDGQHHRPLPHRHLLRVAAPLNRPGELPLSRPCVVPSIPAACSACHAVPNTSSCKPLQLSVERLWNTDPQLQAIPRTLVHYLSGQNSGGVRRNMLCKRCPACGARTGLHHHPHACPPAHCAKQGMAAIEALCDWWADQEWARGYGEREGGVAGSAWGASRHPALFTLLPCAPIVHTGYSGDIGVGPTLVWSGVENSNPQAVVSRLRAAHQIASCGFGRFKVWRPH